MFTLLLVLAATVGKAGARTVQFGFLAQNFEIVRLNFT